MSTYHILNGESLVGTFKETSFAGPYYAWKEDVTTGSIAGDSSSEDWLRHRSEELIREFEMGEEASHCLSGLKRQHKQLEASLNAEQIVLWFENDYFCQMNQAYALAWYGSRVRIPSQLRIFRLEEDTALGTLESADLEKLFPQRVPVSNEVIDVATRTWKAISSDDPRLSVDLRGEDTRALPIINRALRCHLSRFPSVENGLGRTEQSVLEIVAQGATKFGKLYPQYAARHPEYGFGDSHVWTSIRRMSQVKTPLLEITHTGGDAQHRATPQFLDAQISLLPAGWDVLSGKTDALALNSIDQWIGGVHLSDRNVWRWDEAAQNIVR